MDEKEGYCITLFFEKSFDVIPG